MGELLPAVAVGTGLAWGVAAYFVIRRVDQRLASLVALFRSHRHSCDCAGTCGSVVFDLDAIDAIPDSILPSPPGGLVGR